MRGPVLGTWTCFDRVYDLTARNNLLMKRQDGKTSAFTLSWGHLYSWYTCCAYVTTHVHTHPRTYLRAPIWVGCFGLTLSSPLRLPRMLLVTRAHAQAHLSTPSQAPAHALSEVVRPSTGGTPSGYAHLFHSLLSLPPATNGFHYMEPKPTGFL